MRRRTLVAVLLALLAVAGPAAAAAAAATDQGCPRAAFGDVEDEVMCPRCGRPLNTVDRPPQAVRQRAYIQSLIDKCKSKEEIKTALVAQFGPEVLALPETGGFDATAYIVPVLAPFAALLLIALTATRWRRTRPVAAPAADRALDPRDSARLDDDLERYKL